ncbi:MAG: helix-turn-helix domain-containing protein [Chloroflexi bacterium]|nr:helix-turn-helix domain-containing protein [Chloroflexota bacterium]
MDKCKPRGRQPVAIKLTKRQKEELEQMSRSTKMPYMQVVRANIILQAGNGARNAHIAQDISCNVNTVRTWRERWAEAEDTLAEAEAEMEVKEYRQMVRGILADKPRSGTPGKFSAEQLCQIIAVACQPPEEVGCPVTHWTPKELANKVIEQEIVASISTRHIGRFLKGNGLKTASNTVLAHQ